MAILAGGIATLVGFLRGGGLPLLVGIALCALGVLEFTAREHFSGYRSHTLLLAAFPAAAVALALAQAFGQPRQRVLVLAPALPVFLLGFWLLRRRFLAARQARLAGVAVRGR